MIEPREHAERRNWLESLLRKIPGFRGYLEKEYRRESDALQRDWLADRLERAKRALDSHSRALADAGQIDQLPQYDRLRGRLDKLIGRMRGAMPGYSGIFDLVRVDETLLDRVYEYDVALVDEVEKLSAKVEGLKVAADQKHADIVNQLLNEVAELERLWDRRGDMLKGLE